MHAPSKPVIRAYRQVASHLSRERQEGVGQCSDCPHPKVMAGLKSSKSSSMNFVLCGY